MKGVSWVSSCKINFSQSERSGRSRGTLSSRVTSRNSNSWQKSNSRIDWTNLPNWSKVKQKDIIKLQRRTRTKMCIIFKSFPRKKTRAIFLIVISEYYYYNIIPSYGKKRDRLHYSLVWSVCFTLPSEKKFTAFFSWINSPEPSRTVSNLNGEKTQTKTSNPGRQIRQEIWKHENP